MHDPTRHDARNLGAAFCPRFHHAVELIGRRWTGAILRVMLAGATRFSDIAVAVPGLSHRLLAERLRELEAEGLVTRTVVPEMPVRIEYHLTEKGRALEPVVVALAGWAETWIDGETACQAAQACEQEQCANEDDPPPPTPPLNAEENGW